MVNWQNDASLKGIPLQTSQPKTTPRVADKLHIEKPQTIVMGHLNPQDIIAPSDATTYHHP